MDINSLNFFIFLRKLLKERSQVTCPDFGSPMLRRVCFLQDPDLHVKHLKPSPAASSIVNRCIECGFCESNCPSRDITLTPRQRITTYREISRLRDIGERTDAQQQRLTDFEKSYDYDGDATCAADGMCQVKCPVKINTGELIKQLRSDELEGGDHPRATKGAMVSPSAHHWLLLC